MKEYELRSKMIEAMASFIGAQKGNEQFNEILNIYNSVIVQENARWGTRKLKMLDSYAWCAATVSAAAIKSGQDDVVPIEMGVYEMMQIAKARGIYQPKGNGYGPQPADVFIMNWTENGKSCWHTGLIEEVGPNYYTTIEGNANGGNCLRRTILKSDARIIGVVSPLYITKATEDPKPIAPEEPKEEPKEVEVRDTLKDLLDTMSKGDTIELVEIDGDEYTIVVNRKELINL